MTDEPWDQGDGHRRADFEHMLERMQRDHETSVLEWAEASLAQTPVSNIPMPNTAHPSFAKSAAAIRSHEGPGPIFMPKVRPLAASFMGPGETVPIEDSWAGKIVLVRKKLAGPAPFVGDPRRQQAAYVWFVWIDEETGRHVATASELAWRRL